MMKAIALGLMLLTASPALAQTGKMTPAQARARRQAEIRRHNAAQAEAQRLVAQGLNMVSRPAYAGPVVPFGYGGNYGFNPYVGFNGGYPISPYTSYPVGYGTRNGYRVPNGMSPSQYERAVIYGY